MTPREFEIVQWLLDPKIIEGALRSAIHAHGPIAVSKGGAPNKIKICSTDEFGNHESVEQIICTTSSAAKRIRGSMKTRLAEWVAEHPPQPPKKISRGLFQTLKSVVVYFLGL